MNNATKTLLTAVYTTAQGSCDFLCGLIPQMKNGALLSKATAELEAYSAFKSRAETMLAEGRMRRPRLPLTEKLRAKAGIQMETMSLDSEEELGQLLCAGFRDSIGRLRAQIARSERAACDAAVLSLAQNILAYEIRELETVRALPLS